MSPFSVSRTAVAFLAATLFALAARAAEPPPADSVREFRAALLQPLGPGGPEVRKADLQKRLAALDAPGDLAQVLEWEAFPKPSSPLDRDPALRVNAEIRDLVMKKLLGNLQKALSADDAGARAAAATLLGATAVAERERRRNAPFYTGRFPRPGDAPGPAAEVDPFAALAPRLAERTKDEDAAVRKAAVRALVQIGADPDTALPTLGGLLAGDDKDPSVRRTAAAALGDLLRDAAEADARSLGLDSNEATGFLRLEIQAVPVGVRGLDDDDVEVRRHCLEVLREAPSALKRLTENPWVAGPGGASDPQQAAFLTQRLTQIQEQRRMLRSLADALNKALPAVVKALEDKSEASVAANEVLEAAAGARRQMRRWEAALPLEKGADDKPPADPLPALLDALPQLEENLSRPEVRVQLAAVYVLEALGPEAAPAADALVKALAEDANPFVRWGAARALGKMAPARAKEAVPALAKALEDKNEDVRLTAAVVLARYGPAAKSAVPALASAVKRDDGTRLLALQALAAVGADAADIGPTVAAVAAALDDPDAGVRVAAAEALGRLRPLGDDAIKALRKALNDSDGDVRRAASAALLRGK